MKSSLLIKMVLVFAMGLSGSMVSARTVSDIDATQQSAWQRTLTLRMAKSWLQMAANIDRQGATSRLLSAMDEYDQSLKVLSRNAPNSHIGERLDRIASKWVQYQVLLQNPASVANVEALLEQGDDLMYEHDGLMRQWQARLPREMGQDMDLVLQQSMLSERIGMYYLAHYYGLNKPWVIVEMNRSVAAYESGTQEILALSDLAPALLNQLVSNWEYAKFGLEQFNHGQYVPVVMTVTMESMYHQTNTLGDVYHLRNRMALNEQQNFANSSLAATGIQE